MPLSHEKMQKRLNRIRDFLKRNRVNSQREILEFLTREGFDVTQASISRDLARMGIVKQDGFYRLVESKISAENPNSLRPLSLIKKILPAGPNLLVIHTELGGASRAGVFLDAQGWPEIVGTIAGDDTVFVACPSLAERQLLQHRLESLLERNGNSL